MKPEDFIMRLCGMDVSVKFTDPSAWAATGMGRSHSGRGEIQLSTGLTDATRDATFLHEMIHLILDSYGFAESNSEPLVNVLALSFLAWMRDNRKLVAGIAGVDQGYPVQT